jgi:Tetratricopeptide repeat
MTPMNAVHGAEAALRSLGLAVCSRHGSWPRYSARVLPLTTNGPFAMRHPIDGFTIPTPMVRVLEYLASREEAEYLEAWELQLRHAALLYDFSADLLAARVWEVPSEAPETCSELSYENTPFELSPVSWNGGDGLHYDWVVHAPELDLADFPMVSFAPLDDDGAVWLGDDTGQGLAHLLVGRRKGSLKFEREDPLGSPAWQALVDLIGRSPDPDDARITAGARSDIACVPPIPEGYRFEDGPDGVGVLALNEHFGTLDFAAMPDHVALFDREARRLMEEGSHAGALVLLKNMRAWDPSDAAIVARMREAYLGLGRPMHAARAAMWMQKRG